MSVTADAFKHSSLLLPTIEKEGSRRSSGGTKGSSSSVYYYYYLYDSYISYIIVIKICKEPSRCTNIHI